MNDTHHHGGPSRLDLPDAGGLIALLRSVQTELAGSSDGATDRDAERLDTAAEGVAALGDALARERAYSAHVKQHFVDCEASTSYRIGHAIVRAGKAPGRLIASLRPGRR